MRSDPQRDLDALLCEEPYVRALANLLCARQADDVVQQTWLQAFEHRGDPVERPRAWLGRIVRNVAKNFARRDRRQKAREELAARRGTPPSSIELMQREERRRTLVGLVDSLPDKQRKVLLLRYFEGLSPRTIAEQLNLPVHTVWNLHRRAIDRLRQDLDETAREDGGHGRSAWLLPLTGTASLTGTALPPLLPTTTHLPTTASLPTSLLTGAFAMTLKTKLAAAVISLFAVALYAWWPYGTAPTEFPATTPTQDDTFLAQGSLGDNSAETKVEVEATRREVASRAKVAAPTKGTLTVKVYYGGKQRVVASYVTLSVRYSTEDVRLARRAQTNLDGVVTFTELKPGRVSVCGDRIDPPVRADIVAGETANLELTFPVSQTVRGVVIDSHGLPVQGALIQTAAPHLIGRDPEVLAVSDVEGRFLIRCTPRPCLVGARAIGYRASDLQFAYAEQGQEVSVKLLLTAGGGTVEGVVVDQNGHSVHGAIVCVGEGEVQGVGGGGPPMPALVRSDEEGRFRALGVEEGDVPVWVRALDMAPWRGSCVVTAYGTSALRITLQPGGIVRGTVLSAGGAPVAKATVIHGHWSDMDRAYVFSDATGKYELRSLPSGEVTIRAEHDSEGKTDARIMLLGGKAVDLDLRLSRGIQLHGTVTDTTDQPVVKVFVEASVPRTANAAAWQAYARTSADGSFSIASCPDDRLLKVEFTHKEIQQHRLTNIDPRDGTLDVRVQRSDVSVHIVGRVTDPSGEPLEGVRISYWCDERGQRVRPFTTEADGAFALGPLATGTWRLSIRRPGFPSPRIQPRVLTTGARWDLGTIRFEVGGTAIIRPVSVPAADLRFMLAATSSSARWTISADPEHPVTPLLLAGDYRLMVWGKHAAAQVVPVTITAGHQTEIKLHTETGVHQHLEFVYDTATHHTHGATLAVYRGEQKIVDRWLRAEDGKPWAYDLWLLPGTYRVTMAGKLSGEKTLTIGTTAQEPALVELNPR